MCGAFDGKCSVFGGVPSRVVTLLHSLICACAVCLRCMLPDDGTVYFGSCLLMLQLLPSVTSQWSADAESELSCIRYGDLRKIIARWQKCCGNDFGIVKNNTFTLWNN